jgi:hypothetical protein
MRVRSNAPFAKIDQPTEELATMCTSNQRVTGAGGISKSRRIGMLGLCVLLLVSMGAVPARADSVSIGQDGFSGLLDWDWLFSLIDSLVDPPVVDPPTPPSPPVVDTIIERKDPIDTGQSTQTIDIELVSLQLTSADPIDIGGTMHDVFITLDPSHSAPSSSGTVEISPSGTFSIDSFFDVFFEMELAPITGPSVVPEFLYFDQRLHFWGEGTINVATSTPTLEWTDAELSTVPLPAAFPLILLGMGMVTGLKMRRRQRN